MIEDNLCIINIFNSITVILDYLPVLPFNCGVVLLSGTSIGTDGRNPVGTLELISSFGRITFSGFVSRSGVRGEISPRKPGPFKITFQNDRAFEWGNANSLLELEIYF